MHALIAATINSKGVPDIPVIHCPLQQLQQSMDTHCCCTEITGIPGIAGITAIPRQGLHIRKAEVEDGKPIGRQACGLTGKPGPPVTRSRPAWDRLRRPAQGTMCKTWKGAVVAQVHAPVQTHGHVPLYRLELSRMWSDGWQPG
jgi:hypothetical protein